MGKIFMLLAMACFSSGNFLLKSKLTMLPISQSLGLRSLAMVIVLLPFVSLQMRLIFWLRGILASISLLCLFQGILTLPLPQAVVLTFSVGLWANLMSHFFLGEKTIPKFWLLWGLGFIGVILVSKPQGEMHLIGLLLIFIHSVTEAVLLVQNRKIMRLYNPWDIIWAMAFGISVCCSFDIFNWRVPSSSEIWPLLGFVFIGMTGEITLNLAPKYSPMQTLVPLIYSALLWTMLYDWLFVKSSFDYFFWLGTILLLTSTIITTFAKQPKVA